MARTPQARPEPGPPHTGADDSPLPQGALVRYQHLQVAPQIEGNHRFVLFDDGRVFAATNDAAAPAHFDQRFDTPLPAEPTATVAAATVERIRDLLQTSDFPSAPAVVETPMRDGHVVIVTARVDGTVHEVRYRNTTTPLTDALDALHQDLLGHETTLEDLMDHFGIDRDQEPR